MNQLTRGDDAMLCKERVSTDKLARFVAAARETHDSCNDPRRLPAIAEAHDLFEELLERRLKDENALHEELGGIFDHILTQAKRKDLFETNPPKPGA